MLTVPEAAKRVGKDPETVRRWIRSGKLRSQKIGTRHVIDERDLESFGEKSESLPVPEERRIFPSGSPQLDWAKLVRRSREGH